MFQEKEIRKEIERQQAMNIIAPMTLRSLNRSVQLYNGAFLYKKDTDEGIRYILSGTSHRVVEILQKLDGGQTGLTLATFLEKERQRKAARLALIVTKAVARSTFDF